MDVNKTSLSVHVYSRLFTALLLAVLFLIANRGAYEGYFHGDDLDNLSWTRQARLSDFAEGILSPRFYPQNFRPAGHFYFYLMGKVAGLRFPPYVAVLHAIHLTCVILLWLLLRKLGADAIAAGAGALFFAFHMAVFDALWKPMYVFDLLCGLFCLLSYAHRRWILSFAFFWLAYKAKEQAVMLPAVLVCYEYWFGERRWKRLAPFLLVSISFGLQGLFLNPNVNNEYAIRFAPWALWKTTKFYSSLIFLVPYLGLALAALPFVVKDRRAWFGLSSLGLFLAPMLLLPGRLSGAYLYVPLIGAAIVLSAAAGRTHDGVTALFFLIWLPYNYQRLRLDRRAELTLAAENRVYVTELAAITRSAPEMRNFIYDGAPAALHRWGIQGALRWLYGAEEVQLHSIEDRNLREAFRTESIMLLTWDPATRQLVAVSRAPDRPEVSYLVINRQTPVWQLQDGWYSLEQGYRWTRPVARARLRRPPGARQFELVVNVGPDYIKDVRLSKVEVLLNGASLGHAEFTRAGWQTVKWDVAAGAAGPAEVEIRAEPAYKPSNNDPRTLGIAVGGFGFLPRENSDKESR
jgi:hypothetical protein